MHANMIFSLCETGHYFLYDFGGTLAFLRAPHAASVHIKVSNEIVPGMAHGNNHCCMQHLSPNDATLGQVPCVTHRLVGTS
jgi:hypothetical protein